MIFNSSQLISKFMAYRFSTFAVKGNTQGIPRFNTIVQRVSHKSRRKQVNQFLDIKLQANYTLPNNKVVLKNQLNKIGSGFKNFDQFFLDTDNTQIKFDPIQRKVDRWYITKRKDQLITTYKRTFNKFLQEIIEETRDGVVRAEPNFELQLRKSMRSLIQTQGKINIKPNETQESVEILYSELYRGLRLNRNENYQQQSYEIDTSRQNDGIITYVPVKQQTDRHPEFAMKNINSTILKVVCSMTLPYSVSVTLRGHQKRIKPQSRHLVVFQNQLRSPPLFSQWSVTPEQYLQSYRLDNPWIITDIDNSNENIEYLYPLSKKTRQLVNTIQ